MTSICFLVVSPLAVLLMYHSSDFCWSYVAHLHHVALFAFISSEVIFMIVQVLVDQYLYC